MSWSSSRVKVKIQARLAERTVAVAARHRVLEDVCQDLHPLRSLIAFCILTGIRFVVDWKVRGAAWTVVSLSVVLKSSEQL